MQITDDHVEWAVVNRLQKMLEAPPHPEFNVTHTFSLFVSIVCWVVQRIRTSSLSETDQLAASVLKSLKGQKVEDSPWSISTVPNSTVGFGKAKELNPTYPDFANMTVDRFVICLRNVEAHGDANKIRPCHWQCVGQASRELVGFTFECDEKDRNKGVIWSGTITLLEADLRRIGVALAEAYCKSLRHSEKHRRDNSFGSDANNCVIEKAA